MLVDQVFQLGGSARADDVARTLFEYRLLKRIRQYSANARFLLLLILADQVQDKC
jgi:hypothetical protein